MPLSREEDVLLAMLSAYEKVATEAEVKEAKDIAFKAMDALLARKRGGAAKSVAKTAAVRANGAKGGRPRKVQELCKCESCGASTGIDARITECFACKTEREQKEAKEAHKNAYDNAEEKKWKKHNARIAKRGY